MKHPRNQSNVAPDHRLSYFAPARDAKPGTMVAIGYVALAAGFLLTAIGLVTYALPGYTHMRGPKQYTWWDYLAGGTVLFFLIISAMSAWEALFAFGIARKPPWWRSQEGAA